MNFGIVLRLPRPAPLPRPMDIICRKNGHSKIPRPVSVAAWHRQQIYDNKLYYLSRPFL